MASLSNLVPAPDSPDQWVPRPGAAALTTTYTIPGGTVVNVVLTTGSSWTCPADWNNAVNSISCWGAGGAGGAGTASYPGGAGGGAWAGDTNVTLTPGTPYSYQIGLNGGTTGSGGAPTSNTWIFSGASLVAAGGTSSVNNTSTGQAGGSTANSIGSTKYAGGNGATTSNGSLSNGHSGGGGGAAGPDGAGNNGSDETGGSGDAGSGGAGGASGGHAGASPGAWPYSGGGGGGNAGVGGAGGTYGGGGAGNYSAGGNGLIVITYTSVALSVPITGITCQTVVGNLVVGMMNDPGGSGTDIPFVYNLQSNAFETVSGINTSTNCPISPSGAGAWQPPHAEPVGYYVLFSHSGYQEQTTSMYFGAIDLAALVFPQKTVVIGSGSSWVVPADWNDSANQIQCIGSGANGTSATGSGTGANGGNGGKGGGWATLSNVTVSGSVSIQIGYNGTPTWFDSSSNLQAAGGSSGSNVTNGSFGIFGFSNLGGNGANGTSAGGAGTSAYGGGGGGAGGPSGNGLNASGTSGGNGDAGLGGNGAAGNGAAGGAGTEISGTGLGSGGGGGGGNQDTSESGGTGGGYGGGGGGGSHSPPSSNGGGGSGGQGLIIITYVPVQAAVTYTVQNTTTNALVSPPVWITQFNSRAYFFCNPGGTTAPALYCSDNFAAGGPLSRSSAVAGVILTFGDTVPLIGGGVLSLTNISTGGVTQALFVFKQAGGGTTNMFQVTGDVGTTNLAVQAMNTSVSTAAPNTIVSTPQGLFFMALDGLRFVDTSGNVNPPLGFDGQGIATPFLYSAIPSRMAAACNANTIRIETQNSLVNQQQDWCYDLVRRCWHGPHSFPIGLVSPWGNTFIVSPTPASSQFGLYKSDIVPTGSSVYTELGSSLTCNWTSGYFPDRSETLELSAVLAAVYQGGEVTLTVEALDSAGMVINGNSITFTPTTAAELSAALIPWIAPLIFDRMKIQITAIAASGLRLGDFMIEYETEAYSIGLR